MKFTDIASLNLPAGRLTAWRVNGPSATDDRWVKDPRRASCLQEASIMGALDDRENNASTASWLGCAFDMSADLNASAFITAIRQWIDRHETLRSHLIPRADRQLARMTLKPGAIEVRPGKVGNFTDAQPMANQLEALFDREVGPLDWPGYLFTTISHSEATTVCLAVDHTLIDGYSLFQIPGEIHTLYDAALSASEECAAQPALPPVASYLDFAEAERKASETVTASHEGIQRWKTFVAEGDGRLPPFPLSLGAVGDDLTEQPSGHARVFDKEEANAFAQICRSAGGDIFSGLLACLAKSANERTGQEDFRTMIPFQTQTAQRQPSVGWYVGMGPVAFPIDGNYSFTQAMGEAANGLVGVKALAQIPITRVAELLDQPLRDPFMISYMELRRISGARAWARWQVKSFRSRSVDPDEVCLWYVRTHDGLFINYRHPATPQAAVVIADYLARTKDLLTSIIATECW
ncbi:condensation domain-containing protein [Lonsdalea quercina]|uniref:condensation domain-containing protein n=1 Tax=Lonsdalea quercina TaxID=71657 RepID=UPI00397546DF